MNDSHEPTALEVATLAARLIAGGVCSDEWKATERALELIHIASETLELRRQNQRFAGEQLTRLSESPEFPVEFETALQTLIPGNAAKRRQLYRKWLTARIGEADAEKYIEDRRLKGFLSKHWITCEFAFPGWWESEKSKARSTAGKRGSKKKDAKKQSARSRKK